MNIKPPFEQAMRDDATKMIELQNVAIKRNAWQCCLTCEFWQPIRIVTPCAFSVDGKATTDTFVCGKFEQMPPPHIIVTGCPDYLVNIPF